SDSLTQFMALDRSTMRNLDITTSFTKLLDETCTAMGARLLREWISHPLLSCQLIEERQLAVSWYMQERQMSKAVRELLSKVRDLERLMMKISASYATPRDLLA